MRPLLINDPLYGFTSVPRGLLCDVIAHPWFQRLSRIRQLGMSALVYPGAQHTRAAHSIGAFHLMQEALRGLMERGEFLFASEVEAAEAAILLHDIGHGPFSHVLEKTLLHGISHEDVSLRMMQRMNQEMHGALTLAVLVFKDEHPKRFLHELISSQLDTDRLDYLNRDSFFCGVREGAVGAARLLAMLRVADGRLAVDAKGLYTVENYLTSRRVMYWQVYLHKTVVSAEEVLRQALRRAKWLTAQGERLFASPALAFFLDGSKQPDRLSDDWLDAYANLEDNDILSALKVWTRHADRILATLSSMFLQRHLFKAEVYDGGVPEGRVAVARQAVSKALGVNMKETDYFVHTVAVSTSLYDSTGGDILILHKDGTMSPLSEVSPIVRDQGPGGERKEYLFYPRFVAAGGNPLS
ncbi:MAG: HD domain-containing protein [Bacteroidaceae bacterium]|nr:HD domain-containing protein [Bacteroidaceae bacterium]